jgi:DNA-binding beta-propeller fold protein YncE
MCVNPSTNTIYVTNANGNTVSLMNGATCNATVTCSQNAPAVPVEQLPAGIAVDQQTDAVYTTSIVDGDVGRIDRRACTPTHRS